MKHNSKQFLALFMAMSMAVAPVSGVYAEDQNAAVGDLSLIHIFLADTLRKHLDMKAIYQIMGMQK